MTAQDYILQMVHKLAEPAAPEHVGGVPTKEAIYAKVMSKQFRKLKADHETVSKVKIAIDLAVAAKEPIQVGILFGGNKLWRFEESPNVDWAELLSLVYYLQWMKSIVNVYPAGACLVYYSQDNSVESLNNLSPQMTRSYRSTFADLLDWIKPFMPAGVSVVYRCHSDLFNDPAIYKKELEAAKKIILEENNGKLPTMSKAQRVATELNVKLKPGQDDDPYWREKVELEHQAIFRTTSLLPYLQDPSIIPTSPTPFPGLIATGSTKRSIAKFWAGVGALEQKGNDYTALVLSPKQLAGARFRWQPIKIKGLTGENFSKIRVLST